MPRAVTILGLIQFAMILLGFLALCVILRIFGPGEGTLVQLSPLTSALKHYSVLLLLVPALWMAYALGAERLDRGLFSARLSLFLGVIIAFAIPLAYLWAAAFPVKA